MARTLGDEGGCVRVCVCVHSRGERSTASSALSSRTEMRHQQLQGRPVACGSGELETCRWKASKEHVSCAQSIRERTGGGSVDEKPDTGLGGKSCMFRREPTHHVTLNSQLCSRKHTDRQQQGTGMTQRVALLWLALAPSHHYPAVGFSLCCSPAASSSSKCSATPRRNRAASTSRAGIPTSRCRQTAPPSAVRRRRPLSALSAAVGEPAAAAAAEVEEAADEPPTGCERAPHEPAVQAFEAWTARAGCRGSSGSLSHADFDGLPGLMTKAAVPPWQPIATVPDSLFLQEHFLFAPSSPTAAAADTAAAGTERTQPLPPPPPLSVEAWQRCPWWVRLGVRLLKERAAGEESRLQEYVGMLPRPGETGAPVNWSAEQLDRLHYPRLLSQIKLQRRLFEGVVL